MTEENKKQRKPVEEIKREEANASAAEKLKTKRTASRSKSGKKEQEEKAKPDIAKKLQFAASATLSTTERIIGGLSDLYKNIFVGHETDKTNFEKEQGLKYFDKGDYESALEHFLAYIEAGNEKDAEVLFMTGMCYSNSNEFKEAVE
ncbi:MAG: hypothetical protein HQL28_05290, partial [Candidatus Omnitrophica bacterium]|nr:hypothetical protein [Candidatus Omnitrophota bacterium]